MTELQYCLNATFLLSNFKKNTVPYPKKVFFSACISKPKLNNLDFSSGYVTSCGIGYYAEAYFENYDQNDNVIQKAVVNIYEENTQESELKRIQHLLLNKNILKVIFQLRRIQ